uniref:Uncharacterized protein n=1 Tax=Anopheles farauti TaxID=69004 RepID=A0A182QYM7_9DIPT
MTPPPSPTPLQHQAPPQQQQQQQYQQQQHQQQPSTPPSSVEHHNHHHHSHRFQVVRAVLHDILFHHVLIDNVFVCQHVSSFEEESRPEGLGCSQPNSTPACDRHRRRACCE